MDVWIRKNLLPCFSIRLCKDMSNKPSHESQRNLFTIRVFQFQFFYCHNQLFGNSTKLLAKEIFLHYLLFLFGFCFTMKRMNCIDLVNMKGVLTQAGWGWGDTAERQFRSEESRCRSRASWFVVKILKLHAPTGSLLSIDFLFANQQTSWQTDPVSTQENREADLDKKKNVWWIFFF